MSEDMTTGESTPKGGRPHYELEAEDIALAKELAEEGLSLKNIAKALDIANSTLDELRKRDERFSGAIKKARARNSRARDYINCSRLVKEGKLAPAAFIFSCKTKWREFYPQEEKNQSGIDVENPPNLIINFTPPANGGKDNKKS